MERECITETLAKLIRLCRDAQSGYRDAAEHAKDSRLKNLLNEVSLQRARFAGELESEAVHWGQSDVDRAGSTMGAIRRGWTGLKSSLGGGDEAILSSLEHSDTYVQNQYDKYIRDGKLPDDIQGIIRNQAQAIVGTLDRLGA
jgi:uncharacterized protein (TIGR02284 family)